MNAMYMYIVLVFAFVGPSLALLLLCWMTYSSSVFAFVHVGTQHERAVDPDVGSVQHGLPQRDLLSVSVHPVHHLTVTLTWNINTTSYHTYSEHHYILVHKLHKITCISHPLVPHLQIISHLSGSIWLQIFHSILTALKGVNN